MRKKFTTRYSYDKRFASAGGNVSNTLYSLCLTGDFVTQSAFSRLRTKHQDTLHFSKLSYKYDPTFVAGANRVQ
jgi:hypothetical protein